MGILLIKLTSDNLREHFMALEIASSLRLQDSLEENEAAVGRVVRANPGRLAKPWLSLLCVHAWDSEMLGVRATEYFKDISLYQFCK